MPTHAAVPPWQGARVLAEVVQQMVRGSLGQGEDAVAACRGDELQGEAAPRTLEQDVAAGAEVPHRPRERPRRHRPLAGR